MNNLKKLWPKRHKYLMFFWIAMSIPTLIWWKDSVLWVAIMSIYANVEASAAALEANKSEK